MENINFHQFSSKNGNSIEIQGTKNIIKNESDYYQVKKNQIDKDNNKYEGFYDKQRRLHELEKKKMEKESSRKVIKVKNEDYFINEVFKPKLHQDDDYYSKKYRKRSRSSSSSSRNDYKKNKYRKERDRSPRIKKEKNNNQQGFQYVFKDHDDSLDILPPRKQLNTNEFKLVFQGKIVEMFIRNIENSKGIKEMEIINFIKKEELFGNMDETLLVEFFNNSIIKFNVDYFNFDILQKIKIDKQLILCKNQEKLYIITHQTLFSNLIDYSFIINALNENQTRIVQKYLINHDTHNENGNRNSNGNKILELQEINEEFKEKLKSYEIKLKDLKVKDELIDKFKEEVKNYQQLLKTQEAKYENLADYLKNLNLTSRKIDEFEKENKELNETLTEAKIEISSLREKLDRITSAYENDKEEKNLMLNEIDLLKNEIQKLKPNQVTVDDYLIVEVKDTNYTHNRQSTPNIIKEDLLCCICSENKRNFMFLDCHHFNYCSQCVVHYYKANLKEVLKKKISTGIYKSDRPINCAICKKENSQFSIVYL